MSTLTFNDSELQEEYDKFIKNQTVKPNLKFEDEELQAEYDKFQPDAPELSKPPALSATQLEQAAQYSLDTKPASFADAPWLETTRAIIGGGRDAAQEIIDWADTGKDLLVSNVLKATGNRTISFGDNDDEFEFSDLIPQFKQREGTIEDATEGTIFTLPEVDKNETVVGQVARDLTRFLIGAVTAKKIRTGIMGKAKTKTGEFAGTLSDAVLGSQIVSSGDEGRMSDILAEVPFIMENQDVADAINYLKSNPDDSKAEARLKMAIEDVLIAVPIDVAVRAVKSVFGIAKDATRLSAKDEAEAVLKKAAENPLVPNPSNIKVLNYDPVFDSEKVAGFGLNIKFQKKNGQPLFSGADDGVEDLITSIANIPSVKKSAARKAGTGQTNKQTLNRAINSGLTDDVLKQVPKFASTPELVTATRLLFVASANNVNRIADAVVAGTQTTKKTTNLQAKLAQALLRHKAIQERVTAMTANAGRTLQAFNIDVGTDSVLRAKHLADLAEGFGGSEKITDLAIAIKTNKDKAINKILNKELATGATEKLNEVLYFNYLSSPSTWAVNIAGNALSQVYETFVSLPVSAAVSAVKSPFVKSADKVYFNEVAGRLQGTLLSTFAAFKNLAKTAWSQDLPPELKRMASSEYEEFVKGGIGRAQTDSILAKTVGSIVRIPGSILLGTDAFFKTFAKGAYAHQMAQRAASMKGFAVFNPTQQIKIGRKKMTKSEFIRDFMKNPLLEKEALEDAARLTFTKDNKLASNVAKLKKIPVLGNITALYLPFVRTPLNLLEYSLDNSIFARLLPNYRKAILKGGAAKDEAVGRMISGSAVMGASAWLALSGKVTGAGDADYRKRTVLNAATGWQEKSVLINGKYRSFSRFDPASTIIGFGADIADMGAQLLEMQKEKPNLTVDRFVAKFLQMTTYSMWSNMADKAMLAGLANLADDISGAKRSLTTGENLFARLGDNFLKQLARGAIPNISRIYGRTSDPFIRDTYSAGQIIKDAIPFLRKDLPPRYNMFGEIMFLPEYAEEGLLADLKAAVTSITRTSEAKNDEFGKELVRLGYAHQRPNRTMTIKGIGPTKLTPMQYSILEGHSGFHFHQLGHEMINNPIYKAMKENGDISGMKKSLQQIRASANEFGKEMVISEFGEELMGKAYADWLRSRTEDDLQYWQYLPDYMQSGYLERSVGTAKN